MNRDFLKEEAQVATNHLKKCSTSLPIKEMQIKTMLRFHLLLFKWLPSATKTTINLCEDLWEKEPPYTSTAWGEYKLVQPLWETLLRQLKNLKIELPYEPAISVLGIHMKQCKVKKQ
jgi:hypothetical protein